MPSPFRHLAGGVLVNRPTGRQPAPPSATSWRDVPSGRLRRLSNPQVQNLSNGCVSHSGTFGGESKTLSERGAKVQLCRRMIWWEGRVALGQRGQNVGMFHHDAVKHLTTRGFIPEDVWPWGDGRPYEQPPPDAVFDHLGLYTVPCQMLRGSYQVASALSAGHPVPFAFPVDDSYYDVGEVVQPVHGDPWKKPWHSECAIGFDNERGLVWSVGSWEGHGVAMFGLPYGVKGFPIQWFDNPDLISEPYAITGPVMVEV